MNPIVFAFPGCESLVASIVQRWPAELGTLGWRTFPDGESLVSLQGSCVDRDVVFICTFREPDQLALPLLFAARTARELGAQRVGLIAPYLAYMRQDKRFHDGESISSSHFAAFLSSTVDWLVTVDPHLHRHRSLDEIFSVPAQHVSAMPAAAQWIREHVQHPILIGPDRESSQWVAQVAAAVGAPSIVLEKLRRGDRDVEVSLPDSALVKGRTPVLVDDIVSSGHTLRETLGHLRGLGLPPAVCVVVHGIFADAADRMLLAEGAAQVISSNTLEHPTNAIDVSEVILKAVRSLASNLVGERA